MTSTHTLSDATSMFPVGCPIKKKEESATDPSSTIMQVDQRLERPLTRATMLCMVVETKDVDFPFWSGPPQVVSVDPAAVGSGCTICPQGRSEMHPQSVMMADPPQRPMPPQANSAAARVGRI